MALTNERNDFQTTTVASAERIKEIEHVKQVKIVLIKTRDLILILEC
jgi:hypothetical protein